MSQTHRQLVPVGFTLIEMLIVISMIALLIALLLPVLKSARATAQQLECLATQKQLRLANEIYASDEKVYHRRRGWTDDLMPQYMPDVPNPEEQQLYKGLGMNASFRFQDWQVCPAPNVAGAVGRERIIVNGWLGAEDVLSNSGAASQFKPYAYVSPTDVIKPSSTLMYADGFARARLTRHVPSANPDFHFAEIATSDAVLTPLLDKHHDGANYTFVDGHAQTIPMREMLERSNGQEFPLLRPFPD